MKKILLLLALTGLLFGACSKDDEGVTPDVLTGTTWKYSKTLVDGDGDSFKYTGTISFTSSAEMSEKYTIRYTDRQYAEYDDEWTDIGTYTYNKPTVKIIMYGIITYLTVSGNKMTAEDEEGNSITFKKQ